MQGRTDSRRRLLVLLVVFIVGSLALTARLAYWQVLDRERLASEALAQTTITIETPSRRGDVYDRTGTVVLATTVPRERLVAAPDQLTPERRKATVEELTRILGLDAAASLAIHERLTGDAKYLVLRYGLEREVADQIRAAIDAKRAFGLSLEPEPERVYPQTGGGPHSTLAAHLLGLRQPRGDRPVRHRAVLPGHARRRAAGARHAARRERAADPRRGHRVAGRRARHGPAADDRRRAPARGSSRSSSRRGSPTGRSVPRPW